MSRLTLKQERFAQEFVITGNASGAYRSAYDTRGAPRTIEVEASRLLAHPKVSLRVAALREAVSAHSSLTASAVASQLQEISRLAMERKQYGTAVRAMKLLGDMIGAFR